MTAKTRSRQHGFFDIDRLTGFPGAECGPVQAFTGNISRIPVLAPVDHGQADAVGRNRITQLYIGHVQISLDASTYITASALQTFDFAEAFDNTCKHFYFLFNSFTRVPTGY